MNNCPNCGSHVNQGDAFCKVCGTKMPIPQNNNLYNTQQYQNNLNNNMNNGVVQNGYNNDEVLLNAFIGRNVDELKNESFSWCAFFWGVIYALYRKMWLLGIIWIVVSMVTSIFLKSLSGIILFAANIFVSIQFKKWYIKNAKEQIEKIKEENQNLSQEQLIELCRKKGGTSIWPVVITIIVYIGLVILLTLSFYNSFDKQRKNYDNNSYTNESKILNTLKITVPSVLKKSEYSTDNFLMYDTDYNSNYSCSLTVGSTGSSYYNNDAKQYLEKTIYYSTNDSFSGVNEKDINGNKWYYASVTKKNEIVYYYYAAAYNGKIYDIKFSNIRDTDKTCSNAYNAVINSLGFK